MKKKEITMPAFTRIPAGPTGTRRSVASKVLTLVIAFLLLMHPESQGQPGETYDICVYGGTSAGVIAACTAKRLGKKVLLIEPGAHLGGLSAGGLGYTDIGNKYVVTGLARDFYRRVGRHYGRLEQWIFEPHVAEDIFKDYVQSAGVPVWYHYRLAGLRKEGNTIREVDLEYDGKGVAGGSVAARRKVRAAVFIDCSYEGDLMAKAGVSYTVGREANAVYNETYNGVQLRDKHQFPDGISPYKTPGHPESGLLWGISDQPLAPAGSGDTNVQAYNFRLCLTDRPADRLPITRPADYDPAHYELLVRYLQARTPADLNDRVLKIDRMPNHKTDINNNGPFSTDMIGMNYRYPGTDYAERERIIARHTAYIQGFLYFLGHDERVPAALRQEMLQWGYPKDEFTDNGHWPFQAYIREARRMKGLYIMTQANCEGKERVEDGIGMAAYTMDSHNCQRLVVNGMVKNEGDVQIGGFGPYPIAYRALLPRPAECGNLLVPVCLSATHIAYGSIRMEPVFMVLAQSAAVGAVLSLGQGRPLAEVQVADIRRVLREDPLADHSTPEILVDNDDSAAVRLTGAWTREVAGGYGPSMLLSPAGSRAPATARFFPAIKKAGRYHVYAYFPKFAHASASTPISVFDGTSTREVSIKTAAIRVEGQTSGEWVALGSFVLPAGTKAYAGISNKGADGAVAADAVLFIPEFN